MTKMGLFGDIEIQKYGDSVVKEARDLAILICPLPEEVDDGGAIERMPDDLLRAANIIGRLCDLLENNESPEGHR